MDLFDEIIPCMRRASAVHPLYDQIDKKTPLIKLWLKWHKFQCFNGLEECLVTVFILFLNLGITGQSNSTIDTLSIPDYAKRQRWAIGTSSALYVGSMIALNEAWYKDYPRSSFHSFDDSREWLQMDKVGHVMTSYHLALVGHRSLQWAGVKEERAIVWGGLTGFFYLTGVEVLDGFSKEWGFSWYDQAANTLGSAIMIGQEFAWHEQRFKLKYSFHQTGYPDARPSLLGQSVAEQMLKDYNGQTYWLSGNVASFLEEESQFPKWLNVALGYGATGMLSGHADSEIAPISLRQRQYYLSLDADLSRIPTNRMGLRTLLDVLGFVKIPSPTLMIQEGKLRGSWLFW